MMNRIMNKIIKVLAGIAAGCAIMGIAAMADGSVAIVETFTGDTDISLYLRNVEGDLDNINVQIATSEAEKVKIQPISELEIPMRTLIMVDNSLSISQENRSKIAEVLQNLIADRLNKEEICLATFHEDINKLTDYTSDYGELKKALDSMEYQNQETYLTDVLYDLLSAEYINGMENIYHRIIIISDGVDNKSLGYTKEELYSLLKDIQIPVYTIGSSNGKNDEELENLFAISRMTSANYFLLDETEELLGITDELKGDRNVVKLTVTPSAEIMDGSRKSVKVTLGDSSALNAEIIMPQQTYVEEKEEEPPMPLEKEAAEEELPIVQEVPEANLKFPIIIGISVAIAVIAVVIIVVVIKKRKGNQPKFEVFDDDILNGLNRNDRETGRETEIISSFKKNNDNGSTVMIWNQESVYQVVLTDMNSPAKSFQVPLNKRIIVGRKKGECDIALDYEPSVSGKHCEISVKEGRFYVKDLQSSNKTYLNGNIVLSETEIFSGNVLKLGRAEVRFEVR